MYKAPDFVKVSTKMKDVFAGYGCVWQRGYYGSNMSDDKNCTADEHTPYSLFPDTAPGNCNETFNP